MPVPMTSIGKEAATALEESKWWEGKTAREIAGLQLFIEERCCPFRVLRQAVEESLGRKISVHEFGIDYNGICMEFLGKSKPPTAEEVGKKISCMRQ